MENYEITGLIGILFIATAAIGWLLVLDMVKSRQLAERFNLATRDLDQTRIVARPDSLHLLGVIAAFGMAVARSGLLSRKTLLEMTATLETSGFRGGRGLGLFIGTKILLCLLVPLLLYFGLSKIGTTSFWLTLKLGGGAMAGLLLPELITNQIRKRHLAQVEAGVPDALDMMVICADAGLALESGLARVSRELSILNPALAMELTQTSQELRIGADMRQAMESLGQRTGLDTLKRLSATLAQSLQYGTPLIQTLRSLSAELRQEALVKFEERAGRLPTLMTIPMILFILPCVFLIVAGPAIITMVSTLHAMK